MYYIVPEFTSLEDYIFSTTNSRDHHPAHCVYCGYHKVHRHGTRPRQSDRRNVGAQSLNPVLIQRYRCADCRRTFSRLPICIPPRRWYDWERQQNVLADHIEGKSYRRIAQLFKVARSTVSRWITSFKENFLIHADQIRQQEVELLKKTIDFRSFWKTCLSKFSMAKIMYRLHIAGISIP